MAQKTQAIVGTFDNPNPWPILEVINPGDGSRYRLCDTNISWFQGAGNPPVAPATIQYQLPNNFYWDTLTGNIWQLQGTVWTQIAAGTGGGGPIPANFVFSGPATGLASNPTFRALVAADVPNLDAAKITTGQLALARGGTAADLSATGGASQVLKQTAPGAAVTVAQLAASDLSNGTTGSGAVALATGPTFAGITGTGTIGTLGLGSTALGANNAWTGNETHAGLETFANINGIRVVDGLVYTTIQAAINATGSTGCVIIPPGYAGTDAYTNSTGCSIDDRRVVNGLFENRIGSVIAPSFPVTDYPGGHDLVLRTRGSADSYREHLVTRATTAATLSVGANLNVLVSAVTVGNLTRGNIQTGDTSLFGNPAVLGLSVGRDTATAEVVPAGSWSVVDATHLNLTCANSHSGTTDIDLGASDFILSVGTLIVNSAVVKATQTSTFNPPLVIQDSNGNTIGKWPTSRGDIWPYSAWQFSAPITGGFSGGVDLYIRALTAAAKLSYFDFAGTQELLQITNDNIWHITHPNSARPNIQINHNSASGTGAQTFWQYNGATSLLISAQSDTPHIYGGGTSSGISIYGSSGGTGTSGLIRFRNNTPDETQNASIDTANGNIVTAGKITSYNGVTTVSNGVASVVGTSDVAARATAITPTTLFTPATTGFYDIDITMKITTAGTSPVAGPVTITYTDGDGSVAQSQVVGFFNTSGAVVTTTVNNSTTTGTISGHLRIYALTGVAVQFAIAVSGTFGAGLYTAHLRATAL